MGTVARTALDCAAGATRPGDARGRGRGKGASARAAARERARAQERERAAGAGRGRPPSGAGVRNAAAALAAASLGAFAAAAPQLAMGYSAATGYAACVVSVVGFGSNLAPAKWVRTADGVFFALNNVFGIFLVGMALVLARGGAAARFEPLAALGGAAWALGNVCVVPIIKLYGLSLGLLVWGTANMLTGWATGRFGLLGTAADPPLASPALNYAGVLSALLSLAAFSRVGSSVSAKEESFAAAAAGRAEARRLSRGSGSRSWNRGSSEVASIEEGGLLPLAPSFSSDSGAAELLAGYGVRAEEEDDDPFAAMPRRRRQALGFALSLLIGLLYGASARRARRRGGARRLRMPPR